jgi:hypothetical protein
MKKLWAHPGRGDCTGKLLLHIRFLFLSGTLADLVCEDHRVCFDRLLRLVHLFMPFISEELWQVRRLNVVRMPGDTRGGGGE